MVRHQRAQRCDSDGTDSNVTALTVTTLDSSGSDRAEIIMWTSIIAPMLLPSLSECNLGDCYNMQHSTPPGGRGCDLYSDDRDDRRIF